MIANEMHRGISQLAGGHSGSLRLGYERVLRLVDLTVQVQDRYGLRRELLRWRDLVAALYIATAPDPKGHRAALRVLLQMRPVAARQIPLLFGSNRTE